MGRVDLQVGHGVGVGVYVLANWLGGVARVPYVDWGAVGAVLWVFDAGGDEVVFGVADQG